MNQRTSAVHTSDWLVRALKDNPEGLFLLAAGAVLLMRKGGPLGRAPVSRCTELPEVNC